jgi:hypothetical protein
VARVASPVNDHSDRENQSHRASRQGHWLVTVASVALAVRLVESLVGFALYQLIPHAYPKVPHGFRPPVSVIPGLQIWSNWDGLWYLSIAHLGYHGRAEATAFFPAYPLAIAWAGGTVFMSVVISWVAFTVGLAFLWKLNAETFNDRIAWYATVSCLTIPTAFFYGAVYTEALFFAFATAALYLMKRRWYASAAFTIGLASATAIYGILLGGALAIALARNRTVRCQIKSWGLLLLAAWGLLGYMGFLLIRFGHPLLFEHVQYIWGRHRAWPWVTIARAIKAAWRARAAFHASALWLPMSHAANLSINGWNLLFYAFAIALLLAVGHRLPLEWLTYTILSLLLPLLDPSRSEPLMSFPRLFLASIPLFSALGIVIARMPLLRWSYLLLAVPIGWWMMARFVTFRWIA